MDISYQLGFKTKVKNLTINCLHGARLQTGDFPTPTIALSISNQVTSNKIAEVN